MVIFTYECLSVELRDKVYAVARCIENTHLACGDIVSAQLLNSALKAGAPTASGPPPSHCHLQATHLRTRSRHQGSSPISNPKPPNAGEHFSKIQFQNTENKGTHEIHTFPAPQMDMYQLAVEHERAASLRVLGDPSLQSVIDMLNAGALIKHRCLAQRLHACIQYLPA